MPVDVILLNLVNIKNAPPVIDKIKEANVPVILFNREPITLEPLNIIQKAYYVGTDAKEAGILQGKILIDKWKTDRQAIDKNSDGVMQYIMLKGEQYHLEASSKNKIFYFNN